MFLQLSASACALGLFTGVASAAADDAPANFTIIKSTDYGKSMTRQFPAATTARAAVKATVPDLTKYFGGPPKLIGAYQDQKDHKSACVFFSEQLNGQQVNGLAIIKVLDQATSEMIIYCRAGAPKGEIAKLLPQPAAAGTQPSAANAVAADAAGPRPGAAAPNAVAPAAAAPGAAAPNAAAPMAAAPAPSAPISLKPYTFPDNSGTVGVADGWTCNSKNIGGAMITGPADQTIAFDVGGQVLTPNGQTFKMQRMANQQAPNALVGPYSTDPAQALKNLIAAVNDMNRRKGGPTSTVDQIVQVQPLQVGAGVPNGHAAFIVFDSTKTTQGVAKKYRAAIQLTIYTLNQGQDSWGFFATQMTAPADTFKQDSPVMMAQFNSLKENSAVINQQGEQARAAMQAQFAQFQAEDQKRQAAIEGQINQMNQEQLSADRSFDDVDEGIRGTRTVVDTQTGERADANLADVHQIVDNLNEGDPGRYKEIPLRDESDPLPGQ